jgi:hypothetical protein
MKKHHIKQINSRRDAEAQSAAINRFVKYALKENRWVRFVIRRISAFLSVFAPPREDIFCFLSE